MPRKGKRGDDSDDDAPPAASASAAPAAATKGGKKGGRDVEEPTPSSASKPAGKGKKGGRDEEEDRAPTAKPPGRARGGGPDADDSDDGAKRKKAPKGRAVGVDDDDDDVGKKAGKGGKGKRAEDEDDAAAADGKRGKAAGKGAKKGQDDADTPAAGKKKAGRRARQGDDEDEEDEDRGGAADAVSDEEAPRGKKGSPIKVVPSNKRGDDDGGDDEELDDDDAEERARQAAIAAAKAKAAAASAATSAGGKKAAAKGKAGKKGKKGGDDDDDEDDDVPDVLAALPVKAGKGRLAALSDSDEEDKEQKKPESKAAKAARKAKRAAEIARAKAGDDEDEDETDAAVPPSDAVPSAADTAASVVDNSTPDVADSVVAMEPAPAPAAVTAALEPADAPAPEAPAKLEPSTDAAPPSENEPAVPGKKKKKTGFVVQEDDSALPDTPAADVALESYKPAEVDIEPVTIVPAAAVAVVAADPSDSAAEAPVPAPVPASSADAVAEDEVDFSILKKKKKKKAKDVDAVGEPGSVLASEEPPASQDPQKPETVVAVPSASGKAVPAAAAAASAAAPTEFFGEATMGAGRDVASDDIPEEIAPDMRRAVLKQRRGEDLSNRERRLVRDFEEKMATIRPLKAGYGEGGRHAAGDEYGLAAFSLSQSKSATADDSAAAENAKDIIIENFGITAHKKELFRNASLRIAHGRRYGFVGPNGQGKTTLLKHIAARELAIPARISILYVEQEVVADDTPAVQAVLRADKVRAKLLEEERQILADLDAADKAEETGTAAGALSDAERGKREDRLAHVYDELAAMRADASEASARKILAGLGFTAAMMERPTKHFSGGWRMRISLARALFMTPDLLLLDEPTNHLDLNAVVWLQDYLSRWKTTLFIVSHDQDFLSAVVTDIIHLEDKKLYYYKGDYDEFKEMHKQKVEKQWKDYEKQQKMLRAEKEKGKTSQDARDKAIARAKREGAGAKKGKASAAASGGMGDAHDDDKGAKVSEDLIVKPREYVVRFAFNDPPELPPPIFQIKDVSFRYGDDYPWLFKGTNFGIDQTSRIAIVGPNGVGKSTLLNLIIGDLEPTIGEVTRNRFLRVGKYSQHFVDVLPMDKSPVEYLQSQFTSESYQACRNLLGRFGLEGHAHTIPARDLSGGQKARVVFASLCLQAPHVMVLDEPTNNLDSESIDALAEALREFRGGVVLVSHDARLIRDANCLLYVCDKQDVVAFDGDIDDYKSSLLSSIHEEEAALDRAMEARRAEEEAARMAATRERAMKLREMRAKKLAAGAP